MAYAALVSLAQTIDRILNHDQYFTSVHQKQEVISIREYVNFLQAFLEEFSDKANHLEEQIRDAANQAEDIIEYFMLERTQSPYGLIVAPSKFKFEHHPISDVPYEYQLKKVSEKIDSIAWEVMDIMKSFRIKEERQCDFSAASSSSRLEPTSRNDMVVFNHDDLTAIKARLCGESFKLQVIPIVGMGGIGKTTLTRSIYDDPLTMQYFDIRAWITVSQDYSAQKILSSLLASMEERNAERSTQSNESMEEKVYKNLKGRRYLIVMDDMWSTMAWDDVKMTFPDDHNGSRIMLTTRLLNVATYADSSSPPYVMPFMDDKQSWDLLQHKVFTHQNSPPELENIGKEIARNCRGLPLAIVVAAGLLSVVTMTPASWAKIAKNLNSVVATKNGQIAKILSLSYIHLPQHLKQCFLHIGGFPEDHEIRVSELIKLWVAEGFFKPNESGGFEEGAQEYLAELVKRSLVLVNRRKSNGKIKSCIIHDLVRDLCIRKVKEEKFQHRIRIGHFDLKAPFHASTTRTIICLQDSGGSVDSIGRFRLLRVLDVVRARVSSLPAQIFELLFLRYLAFGYPVPAIIPAAILRLQNLQTLIIHPGWTLRYNPPFLLCLPSEIWRLPQLRHLVSFFGLLPDPKESKFPLENLQTLLEATNFICSERILKMIPNLKKLGISYDGDDYYGKYHLENLAHLHQLEKLKLKVYCSFPFRQKLNPVFPKTLKKLTLSGRQLPWKDMTIVGSLPNLEVLKLKDSACKGGIWETTEGEFPQLKFLLIDESDLQHWITESSHFPSLKCLVLSRCWFLNEIPEGIGEIPTLELIEVDRSLEYSAKQIQEEQQSWGNDAFQVRCVSY